MHPKIEQTRRSQTRTTLGYSSLLSSSEAARGGSFVCFSVRNIVGNIIRIRVKRRAAWNFCSGPSRTCDTHKPPQ